MTKALKSMSESPLDKVIDEPVVVVTTTIVVMGEFFLQFYDTRKLIILFSSITRRKNLVKFALEKTHFSNVPRKKFPKKKNFVEKKSHW
jgi:hypothetical protein